MIKSNLLFAVFNLFNICKEAWSYGLTKQGPIFIYEPPSHVSFLNTSGASVDCSSHGNPDPIVEWETFDGRIVRNVHRVLSLPNNGSLVFRPFSSQEYDQKVHAGIYRCVAYNKYGRIVSRDVSVRAVVYQQYEVQVYNEFVIRGNTAVMVCHIPSFVSDYVQVTAWVREDNVIIRRHSDTGGRYSVLENGKLHIRNVDPSDGMEYWCQTKHTLTKKTKLSTTSGQIEVTESSSAIPPAFTDSMPVVDQWEHNQVELPCAAQGNPPPNYRWYREPKPGLLINVRLDDRIQQIGGSLLILSAHVEDSAHYICEVENNAGNERASTTLLVRATLSAYVEPQNLVVDSNDDVILNCTVNGSPIDLFYWAKNGRRIQEQLPELKIKSRHEFMNDGRTLIIRKVVLSDQGMYQCFVKNDKDAASGTTQVLLGNVAPHFVIRHYDNILQPGSTVSLRCGASGDPLPTVTWYLDDVKLNNSDKTQIRTLTSQEGLTVTTLNTSNAKAIDGGRYRCVAKNDVGIAEHLAKINIYGPPVVRKMRNVTVIAGQDMVLRCYVAGYPVERIKWERDEIELKSDRVTQDGRGNLEITEARKMLDEGRYTCKAENKLGQTSEADTWVRIIVRPELGPMPSRSTEEGNSVVMTCSISAGDRPFGIAWLFNDHPLPHSVGITLTNMGEVSLLQIASVHIIHEGNYTCLVTNAAGSSNKTAELRVKSPPVWLVKPESKQSAVGSVISIDCLALGYPKPKVTWTHLSGYHASSAKFKVLRNGTLTITDATSDQSGDYQCQAKNGISPHLKAKITLVLGAKPIVTISKENISVFSGETFELKCHAEAEGITSINWKKGLHGQRIVNNNRIHISDSQRGNVYISMLKMRPIFVHETGVYTCHVINTFENVTKSAIVNVQEVFFDYNDESRVEGTSSDGVENVNVLMIAIPVSVVLSSLFLLLVMLFICVRRKKRRQQQQQQQQDDDKNDNSTGKAMVVKPSNDGNDDVNNKMTVSEYGYKDKNPSNYRLYDEVLQTESGSREDHVADRATRSSCDDSPYTRYSNSISAYPSTSPYATFKLTKPKATHDYSSTELRTFNCDYKR